MADTDPPVPDSPLQALIKRVLADAPNARDYYDRQIQQRTGKTGKVLYDIQRGRSRQPGIDTLRHIAAVLDVSLERLLAAERAETTAVPFRMEGASQQRMPQDVPIFGTALGADEVIDGEAIELTRLNTGDIIGYLKRPVLLENRPDVYGIFVQGSSMSPRYEDGDTVFVEERGRPARIGDDVVVYLVVPDEVEGERTSSVLIKRLERKSASYIELRQYNPPITFRLDAARVKRIDRVIPWGDLVA